MWWHICMWHWPQCGCCLGKCVPGILSYLLCCCWLGELAPSQHQLGEPAPVTAVQRCRLAAEGGEMGVNQASAMQGIGNLTHPKPLPGTAQAEDRHCPAGWMVSLKYWWSQTWQYWGLNQMFKSLWSSNRRIQTKAKLARNMPQTVETCNVFPRCRTHLKEQQKWVKDTGSPRKKSHVSACSSNPAEQFSGRKEDLGSPEAEGFPEMMPAAHAVWLVLTYLTKRSHPLPWAHAGSIPTDATIEAEAWRYHGFCSVCVNKESR